MTSHEQSKKTLNEKGPPSHIEIHATHVSGLLKEVVFGFNDGIVSTFSVIAGLSAANIEHTTILLAALSTLLAGGFSMGLGTYLGSKSEKDLYESELAREKYEMEHMPDVERQEIVDIYAAKGFKGKLLTDVVHHIVSDKKLWLDTMMREELGFAEKPPKPGLNGIFMSASFIIGSLVATFPYLLPESGMIEGGVLEGLSASFTYSLAATISGLLIIGALKTKFTRRNVVISALETFFVGAIAAIGTYFIGNLFA